jgi:CcmD family protein
MGSPANTLNYMLAGYIVIFGAIFLYIGSLVLRFKRLHEEIMGLKEEKEE